MSQEFLFYLAPVPILPPFKSLGSALVVAGKDGVPGLRALTLG